MEKSFCEKYYTPERVYGDLDEVKKDDKAAKYVLRGLQSVAIDEGFSEFKRFNPDNHQAKILWFNDEPIGYYIYSDLRPEHKGPIISQIFIKSEYRRKGFAQQMMEDFLTSYPRIGIYIDSPNDMSFNLLAKMGLVDANRKDIDPRIKIIWGV